MYDLKYGVILQGVPAGLPEGMNGQDVPFENGEILQGVAKGLLLGISGKDVRFIKNELKLSLCPLL